MSWQSLNLKDTEAVQSLNTIQSTLSPVVETLAQILEIVKSIIEFLTNLIVDIPDLDTAALKAAIEAVRAILEDLISGAGCYFLALPIRIVNVVPDEEILFAPDPGGAENALTVFLPPVGGGSGGNWGLMKDVVESLSDQKDTLRPQFDQDAYVAGLVVVAGADSYLDIIPLIEKLKRLFSGEKNAAQGEGFGGEDFPRPRGLTAEIAPAAIGAKAKLVNRLSGTGTSEHPYAVRLRWDLPSKVQTLTEYGAPIKVTLEKIYIYRSFDPIPKALTFEDMEQFKIAEFDFDGLIDDFFDDTIELGKKHYYAITYQAKGEQGDLIVEDLTPYPAFTDIYVPVEINLLPRKGIPPDWIMLPNPIALIPGITDVVDDVNAFLDTLEARLENKQDKFKEYVLALSNEINRYISKADSIVATIRQIVNLLEAPDIYIGYNTFSGKGGNNFFVNFLGESLQDDTDPNRPPFDRGDEVVTGFVIYLGSETAGKIERFLSVLEFLFKSTGAAAEESYKEAADSINYALDEIEEQICFLKNMDQGICVAEEGVPPAFGPDMEPSDEENEGTECQS